MLKAKSGNPNLFLLMFSLFVPCFPCIFNGELQIQFRTGTSHLPQSTKSRLLVKFSRIAFPLQDAVRSGSANLWGWWWWGSDFCCYTDASRCENETKKCCIAVSGSDRKSLAMMQFRTAICEPKTNVGVASMVSFDVEYNLGPAKTYKMGLS